MMNYQAKLDLLSSTHLTTSGVSFDSIKNLQKKYSPLFNRMTIGFECEIAIGNSDIGAKDSLDIDGLRENFNANFHYSQTDYYYRTVRDKTVSEVIEHYDIKPVYGDVGPDIKDKISKTYGALREVGFRVMGLAMKDGSVYWEDVSNGGHSRAVDFAYTDTRPFNGKNVINLGMKNLDIINKFMNENQNLGVKFEQRLTELKNGIFFINDPQNKSFNLESEAGKVKFIEIKKAIWHCANGIEGFKLLLENLAHSINKTLNNHDYIVLDSKGGMVNVDLSRYNLNGLLSPFITYDKEFFNEEYESAVETEREEQWEDERSSAQMGSDSDSVNQNVVTKIHELVLDDVDGDAKYVETYHGDTDGYKGKYTVVEPDSSIKPHGAEVVSPIFDKINEGFTWLKDVFIMIDENDLETNETTGMHVNIGTFKTYGSASSKISNSGSFGIRPHIDVVKLAIFSGDHYLLDQFGRFGNTYARSIAPIIRQLADMDFDIKKLSSKQYNTLRSLNIAFTNTFHSRENSRYSTINLNNLPDKGYLEFRIPGGSNYHSDMNKVQKSVYRYLQLCAIACDETAYFKEYMRELYKVIVGKSLPYAPTPTTKEPRPKTTLQALTLIRLWNSENNLRLASRSDTSFPRMAAKIEANMDLAIFEVAGVLKDLEDEKFNLFTGDVAYAFRLLFLYCFRNEPNPKQVLLQMNKPNLITSLIGSDLYKAKKRIVEYMFTGQGNNPGSNSPMKTSAKLALLEKTHIESATLVYYKNRSTPQVLKKGEKAKPKAGYGPVVKRRRATKDEEAQLKKGKWIRTRHDGKKPGDKGAKRSSYRPKLAAKQKVRADDGSVTDNYSYDIKMRVREFNNYGTFETMLENLKAQTDDGLMTTVVISNANGFIGKWQFGGQKKDEIAEQGIDTILDIEKIDNPKAAYHKPEESENDD